MLDFIPAEDAASLWGLIPEHATPTSDKLKLILGMLFFFRSSIYMLKGADTNAMWHRCQTTKTSAAKQYISANNQASPSPLFHISLHIYFCLAPDPGCSGCKGQQELLNWKHRASQKAGELRSGSEIIASAALPVPSCGDTWEHNGYQRQKSQQRSANNSARRLSQPHKTWRESSSQQESELKYSPLL